MKIKIGRYRIHKFLNFNLPTINKSTRVTRKTVAEIDHILINSFVNTIFKTEILKTGISCHFLICYFSQNSLPRKHRDKITFIYKRTNNCEHPIKSFQQKLHEIGWNKIQTLRNPSKAHKTFLTKNCHFI